MRSVSTGRCVDDLPWLKSSILIVVAVFRGRRSAIASWLYPRVGGVSKYDKRNVAPCRNLISDGCTFHKLYQGQVSPRASHCHQVKTNGDSISIPRKTYLTIFNRLKICGIDVVYLHTYRTANFKMVCCL